MLRGGSGIVIAFICNHCPYVIAIANRLSLEALALAVFELDFLFDSFFNVLGTIHPK